MKKIKVRTAREIYLTEQLAEKIPILAEWIANPERQGISIEFPIWIEEGDFRVVVYVNRNNIS